VDPRAVSLALIRSGINTVPSQGLHTACNDSTKISSHSNRGIEQFVAWVSANRSYRVGKGGARINDDVQAELEGNEYVKDR
jgi:hypothetical protein